MKVIAITFLSLILISCGNNENGKKKKKSGGSKGTIFNQASTCDNHDCKKINREEYINAYVDNKKSLFKLPVGLTAKHIRTDGFTTKYQNCFGKLVKSRTVVASDEREVKIQVEFGKFTSKGSKDECGSDRFNDPSNFDFEYKKNIKGYFINVAIPSEEELINSVASDYDRLSSYESLKFNTYLAKINGKENLVISIKLLDTMNDNEVFQTNEYTIDLTKSIISAGIYRVNYPKKDIAKSLEHSFSKKAKTVNVIEEDFSKTVFKSVKEILFPGSIRL